MPNHRQQHARFGKAAARLAVCWVIVAAACHAARAVERMCALTVELVDAETGAGVPGMVRVTGADGQNVPLAELVHRGQGIEQVAAIHDWWTLPAKASVQVPAAPLDLQALSGLETELTSRRIDLTGVERTTITLPLKRFVRARDAGFVAGNTHLHLTKLSKQQADRYLREVPLADGLEVVFVTYLERAEADLDYTSNKYTPADFARMSNTSVRFGHGQEHRHNFGSYDEGYGHVLLLDIPQLVQPVSIGPGITRQGSDAPPLAAGLDQARSAGGKVIWAHNVFGFEDVPNWIAGRIDALNFYDGNRRGSFKDTYYRYLNIGLRVPFSTGTDWFVYDFSRAYVLADQQVSPTQWLAQLAAGKSYITNGPLLEFTVNGQPLGSVLQLNADHAVKLVGRAMGRTDFKRIELVQNGSVVRRVDSQRDAEHFVAALDVTLTVTEPCWLALRTPPPPVVSDPDLQEPVAENEYGGMLFAHTSPIYLQWAGRDVFSTATAAGLLSEMRLNLAQVEAKAVFANDAERQQVLDVYRRAIGTLEQRLEGTGASGRQGGERP